MTSLNPSSLTKVSGGSTMLLNFPNGLKHSDPHFLSNHLLLQQRVFSILQGFIAQQQSTLKDYVEFEVLVLLHTIQQSFKSL